ncbi:MAG: hypothetical protein ABSD92_09945 [Candidatus Bathyarchaeia archaeon]|jgi:hypothetical protein
MFNGKKTTLFWCGLFVLIVGIINLFSTVLGAVTGYDNYLNEINYFNRFPPPSSIHLDLFSNLLTLVMHLFVWSIIWSISIVVGVYILKSGVKK